MAEMAGVPQHIGVERATYWGPYQWATDLAEANYHVKQLWFDLSDRPIVGVDVECHYDQVCVVQLASWRRGCQEVGRRAAKATRGRGWHRSGGAGAGAAVGVGRGG